MKILLATLLAELLTGSHGQHQNCHNKIYKLSVHNAQQKKISAICKDTINFTSEYKYYAEDKHENCSLIKQGHKPLNDTEIRSNEFSYEAASVFQNLDCNQNSAITTDEKAIMNSLYKQIIFVRQQQDK